LCSQILNSQETPDFLALAHTLLRICRWNECEFHRAFNDLNHLSEWERIPEEVEHFVHAGNTSLTPYQRKLLCDLIDRRLKQIPPLPLVVVAHGIVLALDEILQNGFTRMFFKRVKLRHPQEWVLQEDDVLPVPRPPISNLIAKRRMNVHPKKLGGRPDRLFHIRLAPRNMAPFRVVLDASASSFMSGSYFSQEKTTLLGIGVLNLDWREDFHIPRGETRGLRHFFDVRPTDPGQQLQRIQSIIDRAFDHHVDILLLPELCLPAVEYDQLLTSYLQRASAARKRGLFVAGSRHLRNGHSAQNRCTGFFTDRKGIGPVRLEHSKFGLFAFVDGKNGPDRYEAIHRERELRVYLGENWSLCMLICKDFLDLEARRLVDDLGVSLTTVAAFSPQAEVFGALAASMTQSEQSFVLVANNPVFSRREPQAIFAAPLRARYVQARRLPSTIDPPALCVFEASGSMGQWY
jgi:predicted amidohydrolase